MPCSPTKNSIAEFTADIKRNGPALLQAALQVLGHMIHNKDTVSNVQDQTPDIIKAICTVMTSTADKGVCTRSLWCFSRQNIPDKMVAKEISLLVNSLEQVLLSSSFQSTTVEFEALNVIDRFIEQCPETMEAHIDIWVKLVYPFVISSAPKVAEKALDIMEKHLVMLKRNGAIVSKFLVPDLKAGFLQEMRKIFSQRKEGFILKVWSCFVTILDKMMHKGGSLTNDLLKIVEQTGASLAVLHQVFQLESAFKAFKTPSSEVQAAAYKAWQVLMDNFTTIPEVITSSKRLKLLLMPLVNAPSSDRHESVEESRLEAWWHLVCCLGENVPKVFDEVMVPLLVFIFRLDDSSLQSTSRKTLNLNLQKTPGRAERENNENASTLLMSPAVTRYRTALSMTPTSIPSTLHYESKSLLMKGAEILYQLLKREEDGVPLSKVNLKIEEYKGPRISKEIFLKHNVFLLAALHNIMTSTREVDGGLVLCLWHFMISYIKECIKDDEAEDPLVPLGGLLMNLETCIREECASPVVILKIMDLFYSSLKELLPSHKDAFRNEMNPQGSFPIQICQILFSPELIHNGGITSERFFILFERVIRDITSTSTASGPLNSIHQIFRILDQSAGYIKNKDSLWRLWSNTVEPLIVYVARTNDVNQGNAIEHELSAVLEALLFPVVHLLTVEFPQAILKDMDSSWSNLLSSVVRAAALLPTTEQNEAAEELCIRINSHLNEKTQKLKNVKFLGRLIQFMKIILQNLDYTNQEKSNTSTLTPRTLTKRLQKPLGNISATVEIMKKIINSLINEDESKDNRQLDIHLSSFFDLTSYLFNNLATSNLIKGAIRQLGSHIAAIVNNDKQIGKDKNKIMQLVCDKKINSTRILQKVGKVVEEIFSCVQSRYMSTYDSDLLDAMEPILTATLTTDKKYLRNHAVEFWNATFGQSKTVTYPPTLKSKLEEVKKKLPIKVFGAEASSYDFSVLPETEDLTQLENSSKPVQSPKITTISSALGSPHKVLGSFLRKAASAEKKLGSPAPEKTALKSPSKPEAASMNAVRRRLPLTIDDDSGEFVPIEPSPKKRRILTEHQKEVMRSKRIVPTLYNELDQSQDATNLSCFNQDTQFTQDVPTSETNHQASGTSEPPVQEAVVSGSKPGDVQPTNNEGEKAETHSKPATTEVLNASVSHTNDPQNQTKKSSTNSLIDHSIPDSDIGFSVTVPDSHSSEQSIPPVLHGIPTLFSTTNEKKEVDKVNDTDKAVSDPDHSKGKQSTIDHLSPSSTGPTQVSCEPIQVSPSTSQTSNKTSPATVDTTCAQMTTSSSPDIILSSQSQLDVSPLLKGMPDLPRRRSISSRLRNTSSESVQSSVDSAKDNKAPAPGTKTVVSVDLASETSETLKIGTEKLKEALAQQTVSDKSTVDKLNPSTSLPFKENEIETEKNVTDTDIENRNLGPKASEEGYSSSITTPGVTRNEINGEDVNKGEKKISSQLKNIEQNDETMASSETDGNYKIERDDETIISSSEFTADNQQTQRSKRLLEAGAKQLKHSTSDSPIVIASSQESEADEYQGSSALTSGSQQKPEKLHDKSKEGVAEVDLTADTPSSQESVVSDPTVATEKPKRGRKPKSKNVTTVSTGVVEQSFQVVSGSTKDLNTQDSNLQKPKRGRPPKFKDASKTSTLGTNQSTFPFIDLDSERSFFKTLSAVKPKRGRTSKVVQSEVIDSGKESVASQSNDETPSSQDPDTVKTPANPDGSSLKRKRGRPPLVKTAKDNTVMSINTDLKSNSPVSVPKTINDMPSASSDDISQETKAKVPRNTPKIQNDNSKTHHTSPHIIVGSTSSSDKSITTEADKSIVIYKTTEQVLPNTTSNDSIRTEPVANKGSVDVDPQKPKSGRLPKVPSSISEDARNLSSTLSHVTVEDNTPSSQTSETEDPSNTPGSPIKRRGRPPKHKDIPKQPAEINLSQDSVKPKSSFSQDSENGDLGQRIDSPKKKRGRPPKLQDQKVHPVETGSSHIIVNENTLPNQESETLEAATPQITAENHDANLIKGRGRPRKLQDIEIHRVQSTVSNINELDNTPSSQGFETGDSSKNAVTPKKRRGRPPKLQDTKAQPVETTSMHIIVKDSTPSSQGSEAGDSNKNSLSPKKRRGRPPKLHGSQENPVEIISSQLTVGDRQRSETYDSQKNSDSPKKKRGRPFKLLNTQAQSEGTAAPHVTAEDNTSSSQESEIGIPEKVSVTPKHRRGRPHKLQDVQVQPEGIVLSHITEDVKAPFSDKSETEKLPGELNDSTDISQDTDESVNNSMSTATTSKVSKRGRPFKKRGRPSHALPIVIDSSQEVQPVASGDKGTRNDDVNEVKNDTPPNVDPKAIPSNVAITEAGTVATPKRGRRKSSSTKEKLQSSDSKDHSSGILESESLKNEIPQPAVNLDKSELSTDPNVKAQKVLESLITASCQVEALLNKVKEADRIQDSQEIVGHAATVENISVKGQQLLKFEEVQDQKFSKRKSLVRPGSKRKRESESKSQDSVQTGRLQKGTGTDENGGAKSSRRPGRRKSTTKAASMGEEEKVHGDISNGKDQDPSKSLQGAQEEPSMQELELQDSLAKKSEKSLPETLSDIRENSIKTTSNDMKSGSPGAAETEEVAPNIFERVELGLLDTPRTQGRRKINSIADKSTVSSDATTDHLSEAHDSNHVLGTSRLESDLASRTSGISHFPESRSSNSLSDSSSEDQSKSVTDILEDSINDKTCSAKITDQLPDRTEISDNPSSPSSHSSENLAPQVADSPLGNKYLVDGSPKQYPLRHTRGSAMGTLLDDENQTDNLQEQVEFEDAILASKSEISEDEIAPKSIDDAQVERDSKVDDKDKVDTDPPNLVNEKEREVRKEAKTESSIIFARPTTSTSSPIHLVAKAHTVSSPAASPVNGILKKRLTGGNDSPSPPNKSRRVSFKFPLEEENEEADRSTDDAADLAVPFGNTENQEPMTTPSHKSHRKGFTSIRKRMPKKTSQTNGPAICPELIHCADPIEQILPALTPSAWSRGLGHLVRAQNIRTVGHLCALSEAQIENLPIRSPKIQIVKTALKSYEGQKKRLPKQPDEKTQETDTATPPKSADDELDVIKPRTPSRPPLIVRPTALFNSSKQKSAKASEDNLDATTELINTTSEPIDTTTEPMDTTDSDVVAKVSDEQSAPVQSDLCVEDLSAESDATLKESVCLSSSDQVISEPEQVAPVPLNFLSTLNNLNLQMTAESLSELSSDQLFDTYEKLTTLTQRVIESLRTKVIRH